ncbi:recombinase family protein [Bacillus cereus]|nr:recombinase family protein [Bacillus cereus]
MNIAYGYIRRSCRKQEDNNSLEFQKSQIQSCARRNGFVVPDEFIFVEDATSAFSKRASQRKILMALKEKMIESNVPRVIFSEESRMDRTGYTFVLDFYQPLADHLPNVEVYTANSNTPFNPDDDLVKITFILFRQESEIKSERALGLLKKELEESEKRRPGAKVPYGYDQQSGQLIPNDKADIVTFIFFLHSWGMSLGKIASVLNEARIPSPKDKEWRTSTLETILKNPIYTGTLVWNIRKGPSRKVYEFDHFNEPLVDRLLLHFIHTNVKLQKEYGRLETPFLYLNKLTCNHCNEKLVTHNGSTKRNNEKYVYQYYVCKQCRYKLDLEDVHQHALSKTLEHVTNFARDDIQRTATMDYLASLETILEVNITNTEKELDLLASKGFIAKEQDDREFELLISHRTNQLLAQLHSYKNSQMTIADLYDSIQSGLFFNRFTHLLAETLSTSEKRLIILYFVSEVRVSMNQPAQVVFHNNVLESLQLLSTGESTE